MKAVFFTREEVGRVAGNNERETDLAMALKQGARAAGDEVVIKEARGAYDEDVELVQCDLVILCGVKSRHWFAAYARAGIPWLYFDKGYIRERAEKIGLPWLMYWRLGVCQHHPIDFLATAKRDRKRADFMEFGFAPWRKDRGDYIVLDGGSEKNFKFNGIVPEDAPRSALDEHCEKLIKRMREITSRPVIYRPKPSDLSAGKGRKPIAGTETSIGRKNVNKKDWAYDVERAHAVVTYNGAICVDAHRIGVPSIVLGSAPARPIMSTKLEELEHPYLASDEERQQWLNNLAWCQFTLGEYANGTAWPTIREMMECTPIKTPAEACPCIPL